MPYDEYDQESSAPTTAGRAAALGFNLGVDVQPKKKKPLKRGLAAAAQERGGVGSPLGNPALSLPGAAPGPGGVEQLPPTKRRV